MATMTATMTTANTGGEWKSRMQKRRDFELTMIRRPSETAAESQSLSESTSSSIKAPASPESSHSSNKGSHHHKSHQSFDQLQALQLQLQRNAAQIEANEARMRELQATDEKMGSDIQDRLSLVSQLNQQLSMMREMLARAERVSRGEFGVGVE